MRSHLTAVVLTLTLTLASACGAPVASTVASEEASPCTTVAPVAEDVTVSNGFGPLQGTLTLPSGCGPVPAVLIIAGSGPTDRDGNSGAALQTDMYRLIAEGLGARGVAVLRYDKAGVGSSLAAAPASEEALRFEMGAEDAALFVGQLRADPRVSRVVVAGHSEGALLGMLVAERAPIDGYISIAGAGRPIGVIIREQLSKQIDGRLLTQAAAVLEQLEAGDTVSDVPAEPVLAALFRPSLQPYLISWMKYDPAQEFAGMTVPALIVQGTTDIQVDVADARLLAAARPDAELLLIDGMSHVLKAAALDSAAQRRAYSDPSLPVVPELLERLVAAANP
jgi:uncharacterized protein